MGSQVTTGRGDTGETTALSGEDLSKGHVLVECVGCVDELRAQLALARLRVLDVSKRPTEFDAAGLLFWLMHMCFVIGARCSDPLLKKPERHRVSVGPEHVQRIEEAQVRIEALARIPRAFVVSASTPASAHIDLACTAARRLERTVVRLAGETPGFSAPELLVYLNRQSDVLFMLARYVDAGASIGLDYGLLTPES